MECLHEYNCLRIAAEEALMKQKSRNCWLKLEDNNTTFFRQAVKRITILKTLSKGCSGNRITDPQQIKQLVVGILLSKSLRHL